MDVAFRRYAAPAARLDPRIRISSIPLGSIQRTDDDVPAGPRLVDAPAAGRNMECVETNDLRLRRNPLCWIICTTLRTSVFPSLVRFQTQARPLCRLFRKFRDRDRRSPAFLS